MYVTKGGYSKSTVLCILTEIDTLRQPQPEALTYLPDRTFCCEGHCFSRQSVLNSTQSATTSIGKEKDWATLRKS